MSDSCFGFIEFNIDLQNANVSYPLTRKIVKTALSHGYYLELTNNIEDPMSREIVSKLLNKYSTKTQNYLEFYLTDSPIAPSFDLSLQNFILSYNQSGDNQILNKTNLYLFFNKLWGESAIKKAVIVLGYNLGDYKLLEHCQVADLTEMFKYIISCYSKTFGEMHSVFILSKE